jgi:hypothetical protein
MEMRMFEIRKRHSPMFAMSQIKSCAQGFMEAIQLNGFDPSPSGVKIFNISETARINEKNQFIMRSALKLEEIKSALREYPAIMRLRDIRENGSLMEAVLVNLVTRFGIDSYVCIGKKPPVAAVAKALTEATGNSHNPLMVFNIEEGEPLPTVEARWYDADHPALWIGQSWLHAMDEMEAFCAFSPELKLEVGLNRYQFLEGFGNFSVGLARL